MPSRTKISNIIFSVYIALCFYVYGGSMVNALVGYRTWRWVGAAEFPKFHQVDTAHIVPYFVVFFFLSFIPQVLLFRFRPSVVPKWMVWTALLFNLINMVSTVTIQIPIQMQLDKAFSLSLIDRLIATDLLFRRTSISLLALINFVMLLKVVSQANKRESSTS